MRPCVCLLGVHGAGGAPWEAQVLRERGLGFSRPREAKKFEPSFSYVCERERENAPSEKEREREREREISYTYTGARTHTFTVTELSALICGDGKTQQELEEECDDGNEIDGDGCVMQHLCVCVCVCVCVCCVSNVNEGDWLEI